MYPDAHFMISAAASAQFPQDAGAEVAIVGRSNAGKSSAINAILGRRSLARTSKTPGRTRLLNFFEVAPDARLIDLPGYGYAAGPREDREQWAALIDELRPRQSLRGLLLIVDARRGILDGDRQLVGWAQSIDRPVHVLFSKSDLIKRAEGQQLLRAPGDGRGGSGQAAVTAQLFSAHKGVGLDEARGQLDQWLGISGRRGAAGQNRLVKKESPGSTGE
jgi:GTP-binding protein